MLQFARNLYLKVESLKGKNLLKTLLIVFAASLVIGFIVGYINIFFLNKNETKGTEFSTTVGNNNNINSTLEESYEGKVVYIGEVYPQDGITFELQDKDRNGIILLKSTDQKLQIAENLFVKVTGKSTTTQDGKNRVLQVSQIVIKYVAN